MCYTGHCKYEDRMGNCTWRGGMPFPCPDQEGEMKLLYCPHCNDIKKLRRLFKTNNEPTRCTCGKSWGYYKEDGRYAVVNSEAIVLGVDNSEFFPAVHAGEGNFISWVMKNNPRVEVNDEVL